MDGEFGRLRAMELDRVGSKPFGIYWAEALEVKMGA